ncbi:MAG TPA: cytochrome c [Steroidobacteraceae bacterium]|nr:cytochrome c [Steroidobacteraceae bacterium]
MRRAARWVVSIGVALVLVGGAFAGWVWFASEAHLASFPRPAPFSIEIPAEAAAIARGDHLVKTRGCRGCHGDDLQGQQMWGYAVAPNLARLASLESPAEFEAALRHGIGHDGRALYSMPAFSFIRLRDADVADIIAYLRTVPSTPRELPRATLPWSIRYHLARGTDQAIAGFLGKVPPLRHQDDERLARGEYIAMTTCIECHGFSLRADSLFDDETAPDLIVIAGYDEAAFTHLMRTGKALGDRELPMMSGVARGRFAHFTDDEVHELYGFLSDLAARAAAAH